MKAHHMARKKPRPRTCRCGARKKIKEIGGVLLSNFTPHSGLCRKCPNKEICDK
jgi:hypothetical protein